METGFNLDGLMDALAEKLAPRLLVLLDKDGVAAGVRPRLLTVEQAAVYLGRSKKAVEHMIANGKIPRVRFDQRVFVDVRDLEQLIEDHKMGGDEAPLDKYARPL
jgi:excisionase family DNA binding protein